jgi:hypothetical protein
LVLGFQAATAADGGGDRNLLSPLQNWFCCHCQTTTNGSRCSRAGSLLQESQHRKLLVFEQPSWRLESFHPNHVASSSAADSNLQKENDRSLASSESCRVLECGTIKF